MLSAMLSLATIHVLAVISPGPDFAIILKNALQYSRKTAILTALGIALGVWVHIFYCMLGLSLIISRSIILFNVIKLLGAAYLIYMGYKQIRSAAVKDLDDVTGIKASDLKSWAAIREGFLCNVLNPKASLYFLSLFTLVIKPETPFWQRMVFSQEIFLITFFIFSVIAFLVSHHTLKRRISRVQTILNRVMGLVLLLFGLKLALGRS